LFGLGQFLSNGLGKLVNLLGLGGDLGREFLLSLGQTLLGQFSAAVAVVNEGLQVFSSL
jgi:hypothetical protein